jgi:predicted nucleic acid-binding protein
MVVECAVTAGAQFIVSVDKELLSLEYYRNIKTVSPAGFLALTHTAI